MMTDKIIKIRNKVETIYVENEDVLALRVTEFAAKNDVTVTEAIEILKYQKSLAEGKLFAEGFVLIASEFDKISDSIESIKDYIYSGTEYVNENETRVLIN